MTRPRVGLVLGAGGISAAAFHAGTLLALEHELGWDPRTADIIVGTSAGSLVAALLRAGCDADDLAAFAAGTPARPDNCERRDLLEAMVGALTEVRPRLRRPTVGLPVMRGLLAGDVKPVTAMLALTPFGFLDARAALARLDELLPVWPDRPLWITAVRTGDGARVALCADHEVPVGRAVAASCAIPGMFNPVRLGDGAYVDGAAASPTHADLLADASVDVVVVLSPMSVPVDNRRPSATRVGRSIARRRLMSEVAALKKAGQRVHVLEPDAATVAVLASNPLARQQAPDVMHHAFRGALRSLGAQIRHDLDV